VVEPDFENLGRDMFFTPVGLKFGHEVSIEWSADMSHVGLLRWREEDDRAIDQSSRRRSRGHSPSGLIGRI
jgi:hypothetical protein